MAGNVSVNRGPTKQSAPGECRGEVSIHSGALSISSETEPALFVDIGFSAGEPAPHPGSSPGWACLKMLRSSQTIENLIGPEPLQPVQRLVEGGEFLGADAADLLDSAHMLLIEPVDDVAHLAAL